MSGKMVDTKFTIQFSRTDPMHLQVAEILNRQGRRSKAQYIVNAVLYYINNEKTRSSVIDEKQIEMIINRVLQANEKKGPDKTKSIEVADDITAGDVLDSLGKAELNAITGALDMFRKN